MDSGSRAIHGQRNYSLCGQLAWHTSALTLESSQGGRTYFQLILKLRVSSSRYFLRQQNCMPAPPLAEHSTRRRYCCYWHPEIVKNRRVRWVRCELPRTFC